MSSQCDSDSEEQNDVVFYLPGELKDEIFPERRQASHAIEYRNKLTKCLTI